MIAEHVDLLPMSPAQQRLWFLDQMDPGTTMFNIPAAFRFHGPFDVDRARRVLDAIVERHEVLRTTLTSIDGESVQAIHPARPADLPVVDLSALAPDVRDAALQRELRAAAAQPFDLARGPLFRPALWRLGPDDHVLMLCMHHAISDGWSLGVLADDFAALWTADRDGTPSPLAPLAIQYADYAHWHRTRMESGELEPQRRYWLEQLRGHRGILRLPTDRPRPARQTFNAGAYEFRLSATLVDQLRAAGKEFGVSLFMTTITAYALLLARYSGQDDLLVGIPAAGRTRAELEPLVGFFVNALVLRFRIDGAETVRDALRTTRRTVLDAFGNQDLSLDALMESLEIERDPAFEPLVQATFALQNVPRGERVLTDLDVEPIVGECMHSRYDLMLLLAETPDGLAGNMVYNTELFERATIARMMLHLERLLEGIAAQPEAPLASLSLVTPPERYALVGSHPEIDERILPLAPMQRDLYVDSLSNPESRQNCVGLTYPLPGAIDVVVWAEAVQALTDAQPVLRTRLRPSSAPYGEAVYQCVLRADRAELEVLDLAASGLSEAEVDARVQAIVRRPYDPHGRLVHHFLVRRPSGAWLAGIANHHLLLDGIATTQAAAWIAAEYTRRMGDEAAPALLAPSVFHDALPQIRAEADTSVVLARWRELLANVAPLVTPAADPAPRAERLAAKDVVVPGELWAAARQFCRTHRVTPQILMKCVFALVADAYGRCDGDLLIQEFITGRGPGHASALGCYYQALPFVVPRARLGAAATIAELLAYARAWQKDAPDRAGISLFEQRRIAPAGRVSLLFNFITATLTIPVGGALAPVRRYTPYADGFVQFEVSTVGEDVHLGLTYDRSIFAEDRLLERALHVLEQLLDGTERLRDLRLLLPAEEPAAAVRPQPGAVVSIAERILRQAAQTPDAPAVEQGERVVSYRELVDDATAIAGTLRAEGIGAGDLVGVCLERSPLMIVALVAVLQSGAAYVPMDAAYPEGRLRHMAADARCRVILTESGLAKRFEGAACRLLALDAEPPHAASDNAAPCAAQRADDPFYVLYTSGSTGMPKGAAVTERGVANLVDWYVREFGIGARDRVIVVSAFGFDLTQKNFFAALTTGATLVLPPGALFEPERVRDTIEAHAVTIVNCAPSAFSALLDDPSRFAQLRSLRHVFLGGEPIPIARMEGWLRSPDCRAELVNTYGPTECTDVVCFHRLPDPLAYRERNVPLGVPIDDVALHVLDDFGRALPAYAIGELCLSGVCVGNGYWRNPELTARSFGPNPFGPGRLYRTGDLVYRGADGLPVFVGRRDFQVKVRGLRIELGEIEAALRDVTDGADWLVLAVDDALLAYVHADAAPSIAALRGALASRLPPYMLPQRVAAVAAWPLGPNGKIDRAALARRLPADEAPLAEPPASETELRLAQLWSDALGRPAIGRDESFFALGGHSLLATRVAARIRSEFGVQLPLRAFFDTPTIAALGSRIDELLAETLLDLSVEEIDRLLAGEAR